MRRIVFGLALTLLATTFAPVAGSPEGSLGGSLGGSFDQCLSSPVSVICPTCPVQLRCYTTQDWLDFFLPGWDGIL